MKKLVIVGAALAFVASACNNGTHSEEAKTTEKQEAAVASGASYSIDTAASKVEWTGTKPVGAHHGTLKISEGSFSAEAGNLTAGAFTIDINSLNNLDMKAGDGKEKLEGHLKSPDFFDAAKYPTAKFVITSVSPLSDSTGTHQINGNLTLKDSTKNVSFPAKISIADNAVKATADFSIDRTQWGLFYGNDKSLGDKFIRPEVDIKLDISAVQK
ncbi:MAG TPA: YceI family protein [Flavihumibacter sp.]|nr:YceI family protein [Bacteroidota bacterium]HOA37940.1 YceI family protein [Flavihumibacter sp.]HPZ87251.1 YceI family protein [Flavihumibacter sp.]HQD09747.1 YceI family protein [Flavihumibacter sp.]